jgi:hypothetical protein
MIRPITARPPTTPPTIAPMLRSFLGLDVAELDAELVSSIAESVVPVESSVVIVSKFDAHSVFWAPLTKIAVLKSRGLLYCVLSKLKLPAPELHPKEKIPLPSSCTMQFGMLATWL